MTTLLLRVRPTRVSPPSRAGGGVVNRLRSRNGAGQIRVSP